MSPNHPSGALFFLKSMSAVSPADCSIDTTLDKQRLKVLIVLLNGTSHLRGWSLAQAAGVLQVA